MTWFDHQTSSIWTQPWGQALAGELKGTQLQILPFSLVPWATWKAEHPDTLALLPDRIYGIQPASDGFVVGVALGDDARGYDYRALIREGGIINDRLGDIPLVIHVNASSRSIHLYVRQLPDGTELTFTGSDTELVDEQTRTVWNPVNGLGLAGELQGEALRELPYISSFYRDWQVFYPHTDFFE